MYMYANKNYGLFLWSSRSNFVDVEKSSASPKTPHFALKEAYKKFRKVMIILIRYKNDIFPPNNTTSLYLNI